MADYNTITVPAGGTRTIDVGPGETFANTLIDITADGASCRIHAYGDGWTVKNVGVKGTQDTSPKKLFVPSVPTGGSATVEHLYLGDGTSRTDGNRQGGVWVNANAPHEGDLLFRECYIGNWADNGLYGSGPAAQIGSRSGSVRVEQSFAKNNNITGFRIGGAGSYVKDSTIVSDARVSPVPNGRNSRAVWVKDYGTLAVENCDMVMTGPDATHAVYASHGAHAEIRDCRVTGGAGFNGSVSTTNCTFGDADPAIPAGVPTTAEEAASGTSSASGDSGTSQPDPTGTLFEVWSADSASNAQFEFTADGPVTKKTSGEPRGDNNDAIADNGDGTYTVTGVAGNGYGDGFYVDGAVTNVQYNPDEFALVWDGQDVTADDLPFGGSSNGDGDTTTPMRTIRLTSPDQSQHNRFHYALECDTVADTTNVEPDDTVTTLGDGTERVEGSMVPGGHADQYTIEGRIYSVTIPGDLTVAVDGAVVDDPSTLVDGSRSGDGDGSGAVWSDKVVQSSDGSGTLTIAHGLGATPSGIDLLAASPAASTDHWVTDVTASDLTLQYAQAKDEGTALDYYVTVRE